MMLRYQDAKIALAQLIQTIFSGVSRFALIFVGICVSVAIVLNVVFPPPLDKIISESVMVNSAEGQALRAFPTREGRWRLPVSVDDVDPHFVEALVRVEDKRFYTHFGVDYIALARASFLALWRGRIDSGASTITMQTARLLEPRPRNIGSKIIEIFRAHQIEARLSKKEIIQAYLTLAPYGGNLEGLQSANWSYFGKSSQALTDPEIALLLALPQAPEARRPDRKPELAERGRNQIAKELVHFGIWSEDRGRAAAKAPIPSGRRAMPNQAWHATQRVKDSSTETETTPHTHTLETTIHSSLQYAITQRLEQHLNTQTPKVQAGAILVHIPQRCVIAYAGSTSRQRDGGWIDLMAQPRSPGSALKPFIYGNAMDRGIIRPETVLRDFPTQFGTYRPENFDKGFRGDVRVSEALQHSLNIPAVQVLDTFGAQNFKAALDFAGIQLRMAGGRKSPTGLSLALGAVGINAIDLVTLYAGLGDEGKIKPLRWRGPCNDPAHMTSNAEHQAMIMSPASANNILNILRAAPTPAGRAPARLTLGAPQIGYKTGTSYGFRDAWAAGIAGDLAIVVWVGRADGAPNGHQTGRSIALPLMFDLVDMAYASPIFQDALQQTDRHYVVPKNTARIISPLMETNTGPAIIFPPDNAELFTDQNMSHSFTFAARTDLPVQWYVDGKKVTLDNLDQAVWSPESTGFFTISAVDSQGQRATSNIRVKRFDQR